MCRKSNLAKLVVNFIFSEKQNLVKLQEWEAVKMISSSLNLRSYIRERLIFVIFKSMRQNDLWGIRHTIFFFSFTLEALWIFSKLVLFQPICPNSTRPHQNCKSLGEIHRASIVKLKKQIVCRIPQRSFCLMDLNTMTKKIVL